MRSPASRCRRAGSASLVTSAARVTVRRCSSHSSQNSWRPNFSLGSCLVACEDSGHACQVFPGFALEVRHIRPPHCRELDRQGSRCQRCRP